MKKIGTTCYIVSKAWKQKEHLGAKVLAAKIIGYQNLNHKIYHIIKYGKIELSPETNHIFYDLEKAINQIKSKK